MMNTNLEEKINTTLLRLDTKHSEISAGRAILDEIQREYCVEPKGAPIESEDVRKGDRIRVEYMNGNVAELTVEPISNMSIRKIYLLDRPVPEPDPDADFVFPDKDGAIVQMESRVEGGGFAIAIFSNGRWAVTGSLSAQPEETLRNTFRNFKVVSDGSEQ